MSAIPHSVVLADGVDLKSGWSKFFSLFPSNLVAFASVFGVACLVFAIVMYAWSKFRNRGNGGSAVVWALVIGMIFSAPGVVGPLLLGAFDVGATVVVNAFHSLGA